MPFRSIAGGWVNGYSPAKDEGKSYHVSLGDGSREVCGTAVDAIVSLQWVTRPRDFVSSL
ncbi:MAG: hypothetical protein ABIP55_08230 [Tepidisphaeraceae bacterium]